MDDKPEDLDYPKDVRFQVHAHQQKDFHAAADLLNINRIDACIVQHDFGIYGGDDGSFLLSLLGLLRMPILCVLHSVPAKPSKGQADVTRQIIDVSDRLIVTSQKAKGALE